jgi:hypothetical protein
MIVQSANSDFDVVQVTQQTIKNVRQRFLNLQNDEGTRAAFNFLVYFAISSKSPPILEFIIPYRDNVKNLTPLTVARALREYVAYSGGAPEYSAIAESAAVDAIVAWYSKNKPEQENLFQSFNTSADVWGKVSKGSGFCELSRLYFSKVLERYLSYFLERESSQALRSVTATRKFRDSVETHIEKISRHAFETSKITQSYSAGWFNKYAIDRVPSEAEIQGFISYAFHKLQDELMREENVA